MLLLIAFALFFAMFAVWLIVPTVSESRKSTSAPPASAATTEPVDSTAMPVRA